MKRFLLFIFLLTAGAQAQTINFADPELKARLLSASSSNNIASTTEFGANTVIDINGNGEIEVSEALLIKRLSISSVATPIAISNLSGLENFHNLLILDIKYNNISDISMVNATNFPLLKDFNFRSNDVTTLNVSGMNNLLYLDCQSNLITNLSPGSLPSLLQFSTGGNTLSTLNLSGMPNLTQLYCAGSGLTSLDLTGLSHLSVLNFRVNNITTLDLSPISSESLMNFVAEFNQLQTVDLNRFTNLSNVYVANNPPLTTLLVKNGKVENNVSFYNNPNLSYVCGDDAQLVTLQSALTSVGLTNCVLSSYCSFTPGGDYNTIRGNVHFDSDNNGCDSNDVKADFLRVDISGAATGTCFVNALGGYDFYTQAGNHTITPQLEQPGYFNVSPISATANFPLLDNSTIVRDFCLTANGYNPDMEIVLLPLGNARAGFEAHYQLVYKNKGNQITSGQVTVAFEGNKTDFISANVTPSAQTDDLLSWSYSNLMPFEVRTIDFWLSVNSPTDEPAVHAGDVLHFNAGMNLVPSDPTPQDNSFVFDQIVANAIDPNDKTCLEGEYVTPEKIGQYLHYNINFENIGTSEATNIVIKDIIDTTRFDIGSLQVMQASHAVRVKITGNVVEFLFQDINLPSVVSDPIGGHGNVLFKIKTLPTLQIGDMVTNTANIYFDYNHPIETNQARTTFNTLKTQGFHTDASVSVYPNPARNNVTVSARSNIQNITLFDVAGRILQTLIGKTNHTNFDISNQQDGVYFLKITTDQGVKVEQIIKK